MANTVSNQLTQKDKQPKFSQVISSEGYQKLLESAIRDPKRRNRFVTAVVSAVSANPLLERCDSKSIISAALLGEALELSPAPSLGEYWMVPYRVGKPDFAHPENDKYTAKFQIGVNGITQLAMRTGLYLDIDALPIYEGEYKERDRRTGRAVIEFGDDNEGKRIVGYYAYFELLNGFFHSVYFSAEKVLEWADRYSKAFDRSLYERYIKGEVTDWKEQQKCSGPWYEHFDDMACNTVLKRCLKRAPKSIEMQKALDDDEDYEDKTNMPEVFKEDAQKEFFEGIVDDAPGQDGQAAFGNNKTTEKPADGKSDAEAKGRKKKAAEMAQGGTSAANGANGADADEDPFGDLEPAPFLKE